MDRVKLLNCSLENIWQMKFWMHWDSLTQACTKVFAHASSYVSLWMTQYWFAFAWVYSHMCVCVRLCRSIKTLTDNAMTAILLWCRCKEWKKNIFLSFIAFFKANTYRDRNHLKSRENSDQTVVIHKFNVVEWNSPK